MDERQLTDGLSRAPSAKTGVMAAGPDCLTYSEAGSMVLNPDVGTRVAALKHHLVGYSLPETAGWTPTEGFGVLQDDNGWYGAGFSLTRRPQTPSLLASSDDFLVAVVEAAALTPENREALLAS